MPKIKWVGNKAWDTEFPAYPVPAHATLINRPDNIFTACLPYGIGPLLLSGAVIFVKWYVLGSKVWNPLFMPIGIVIGLLLTPVHEYLHAICFPPATTVYVGISLEKFAAFAVCNEPLTRTRFIVMSLMPVLLGIIPYLVFLICPLSAIISGICIPVGMIGLFSPMPDYMDIHILHKQVPKGAMIQSSNDGLFWYK